MGADAVVARWFDMATPSNEGTERKTDRLEAFSDAVLAIAITLPVVELHAPGKKDGDLASGYLKLLPDYGAYILSVILIGLYWAHSHFSGKIFKKTDHWFNLVSIGFLAAVSITPFPAKPLFEHISGDAESQTAALVYMAVASAPATWWLARWVYATRTGLLDPRLARSYLQRLTFKYSITAAAYWMSLLAAFWNWRAGLAAAAVVTLSYVVPPMQPAFKPGQQPRDALEEADEEPG